MTIDSYPNLPKVLTSDLVDTIKSDTSGFKAQYVNWAKLMQLLRDHAPGWLPELVRDPNTHNILHKAPDGGYLMIRFRHISGEVTPEVPQAVMSNNNSAMVWEAITARDITDTHRRGVCMAAAFTFGLAYALWAKIPVESGYVEEHGEDTQPPPRKTSGNDKAIADWLADIETCQSLWDLERIGNDLAKKSYLPEESQKLRAAYAVKQKYFKEKTV